MSSFSSPQLEATSIRLNQVCRQSTDRLLFPPPPPRSTSYNAPTRELPPLPPAKDFPRHYSTQGSELLPTAPLVGYQRTHSHSISASSSSSSADSEESFWSSASSSSSNYTSPALSSSSKSNSLMNLASASFARDSSSANGFSSLASDAQWQAFSSPVWSTGLYSHEEEPQDYLSLPMNAARNRIRTESVASGQTASTITAASVSGKSLRGRKSLKNIGKIFNTLKKSTSQAILRPPLPQKEAGLYQLVQ